MFKRKYKIDEGCFDVLNTKSAYWLGFFWADGYVNGNRVQVALSAKDKDLLKQLKDFIKSSDRPIREFLSNQKHNVAELRFRSSKILKALSKYKIHINKRDRGRLPISLFHPEYRRDFLRGYFDGDGALYVDKRGYLFCEITGEKPLLRDVKQMLVDDNITTEKKKITKNGSVWRIRLSASDTLKFCEYIYHEYPNIYRLDRKYFLYKAHSERLNNLTCVKLHVKR